MSSEWLFHLEHPHSASYSSYTMTLGGGVPAIHKAIYPGLFYTLTYSNAARQRRRNWGSISVKINKNKRVLCPSELVKMVIWLDINQCMRHSCPVCFMSFK